jgi:SAM-dependent methyltransferase
VKMSETKFAASMRHDWDVRARKDALYYIASWRKDWDTSAFLTSGEEDYKRLVAPVLERFGFRPQGKTMLELGCGAGRMTSSFALRFAGVSAFDVSAEMLDRASTLLNQTANVTWVQGNGINLAGAADSSVDFVFSYLVLQHLPAEELVCSYTREMFRVLRPGGLCLFQWDGLKRRTMNWRGHLAWGLIDFLWGLRTERLSRVIAQLLGLDPQMAGKSWHGIAVSAALVAETARASGGRVLEIRDENTPMAWCCAKKESSSVGVGVVL